MNLILLQNAAGTQRFPANSPQALHLRKVLNATAGTTFWCGLENGARGLASIISVSKDGDIDFSISWEQAEIPKLPPIRLLIGMSRPQTMKKVLASLSELGCAEICVFPTEKGDPAYAQSSLWREDFKEVFSLFRKSAEQTCTTLLPNFVFAPNLSEAIKAEKSDAKFFLDVYAQEAFPAALRKVSGGNLVLAIGSERGWSQNERERLQEQGFAAAHLGERVLRVETASALALGIALAEIDYWKPHRVIL